MPARCPRWPAGIDDRVVAIAPNGTRIRNLCLMAESVMSDARHTFLMFAPDFCNEAYAEHPLHDRVTELFAPPFRGRVSRSRYRCPR